MKNLPVDQASIRRGALFLINIGTPIIVGTIRGEPRAALLGAIVGMVLSFADNDGALSGRLRLLFMAVASMVAGGLAGYWLRDAPIAFWPVFTTITFSVGMAARAGREPLLISRDGAMAFAVAAGIPAIESQEIHYLVGALLLNAVSRCIDHMFYGPLPGATAGPRPQMPSGHGGWLRFGLGYAFAATGSLWIGMRFDPVHTMWIVTTTLVVMQPDARASYRRILERIGGTLAAVSVAWAVSTTAHSAVVLCAVILVVAPLIPHHLRHRYWLHTALIALMILLAYDLMARNTGGIEGLLRERLVDMLIGCAAAAVGTVAAFTRFARPAGEPEPDDIDDEDEDDDAAEPEARPDQGKKRIEKSTTS